MFFYLLKSREINHAPRRSGESANRREPKAMNKGITMGEKKAPTTRRIMIPAPCSLFFDMGFLLGCDHGAALTLGNTAHLPDPFRTTIGTKTFGQTRS